MNDLHERLGIIFGMFVFVFILMGILLSLGYKKSVRVVYTYPNAKGTIHPKHPLPATDTHAVFEVKGTFYNPVSSQCDKTPFITADGSHISLNKLKKGAIKWVALSRDLLKRWNGPFEYGDTLYVHHGNSKIRGMWIVHDSMNARWRKRIDFLQAGRGKLPGVTNNILVSNKPFYNER